MYAQLLKIFLVWGAILSIVTLVIAIIFSTKINNIEKITTPFWTGMGVGFTSMFIHALAEYFVLGSFSWGSGMIVTLAAGFGGRMAASRR